VRSLGEDVGSPPASHDHIGSPVCGLEDGADLFERVALGEIDSARLEWALGEMAVRVDESGQHHVIGRDIDDPGVGADQ